ncbi:MAG: hypothetical protein ACOY44_07730 [Pseudomonadota bacterium]
MKMTLDLDPADYRAAQVLASQAGLSVPAYLRARLFSPDITELTNQIESTRSSITEAVQADLIQLVQSLKKGTP